MKQQIKSAIVFKCDLPVDTDLMASHLQTRLFTDPLSHEAQSVGFINVLEEGDGLVVQPFEGGYAVSLRIDTKIIPGSVVKAEAKRLADEIEKVQGYTPGRKQRKEIKEQAFAALLPRALVRTQVANAFYLTQQKLLFVATTSKSTADHLTGSLVRAVESAEFSTLHVSGIAHGLTARLRNWLSGDDDEGKMGFGAFEPRNAVQLVKRQEQQRQVVSVNVADVLSANQGLTEALEAGFNVASIRLSTIEGAEFTLTDDFNFRSIFAGFETGDEKPEDVAEAWRQQVYLEAHTLSQIITDLLAMMVRDDVEVPEAAEAA